MQMQMHSNIGQIPINRIQIDLIWIGLLILAEYGLVESGSLSTIKQQLCFNRHDGYPNPIFSGIHV